MRIFSLIFMLIWTTSARQQLPQYQTIEDEYGEELPFQIASDQYYSTSWQRIYGDPHVLFCSIQADSDDDGGFTCLKTPQNVGYEYYDLYSPVRYPTEVLASTGEDHQLHEVVIVHGTADILFSNTEVQITDEEGTSTFYNYDDNINHQLPLGATLRSNGVKDNVEFQYQGFQMTVIQRGGTFNLTGGMEYAMSVNVVTTDFEQMDGLVGQVHGFHVFSPESQGNGKQVMVRVNKNGVYTAPLLATRRRCQLSRDDNSRQLCLEVEDDIYDNRLDYISAA